MSVRIASDAHHAVIFDLDGVVTDTASVHASAWKRLFDDYLARRSKQLGQADQPFSLDDYRRYVDGKPRYDGVDAFMRSRGIALPWGAPEDGPDGETVCALGNRKNGYFEERLNREGVTVFDDALRFIGRLQQVGIATGVISASRNCLQVLQRAGLEQLFEVRVDGVVADDLQLPGKPDPAVFLEAARRLNVRPVQAVVVEDALAGVEAGRRGGFTIVIGLDRHSDHGRELENAGADVVVSTLDAVDVVGPSAIP